MGYSAFAIANYFLAHGEKEDVKITPLMIQKLVYIAHGYHLAFTAKYDEPDGDPLVNDEFAEAWQYGPVFPSLYHRFRKFGGEPITDRAEDNSFVYDKDSGKVSLKTEVPEVKQNDKFVCALLDKVWDVYKGYTGYQLSSVTHKDGTPWDQTMEEHEQRIRNAHISNGRIRDYYLDRIGGRK